MAKILTIKFPEDLAPEKRGHILGRAQLLMYSKARLNFFSGIERTTESGNAFRIHYDKDFRPAFEEFEKCLVTIAEQDGIKLSIK